MSVPEVTVSVSVFVSVSVSVSVSMSVSVSVSVSVLVFVSASCLGPVAAHAADVLPGGDLCVWFCFPSLSVSVVMFRSLSLFSPHSHIPLT